MKKVSPSQRERDRRRNLGFYQSKFKNKRKGGSRAADSNESSSAHAWLASWRDVGLELTVKGKRDLALILPEKMNFSTDYETTARYIKAIRNLPKGSAAPTHFYRLKSVEFRRLKRISTSAALLLTAELSKWDDRVRNNLRPNVKNWSPKIFRQFYDLGFFNLFSKPPKDKPKSFETDSSPLRLVKYIKGRTGESSRTRMLRTELEAIIGDDIEKWTFLRGGLDEAITNVSHHAYPRDSGFNDHDRFWYLCGSFNQDTNQLKIVFYDQGIGIPASLPASEVWERVLKFLSRLEAAARRKDETLLKAAVELDRTSTRESDRGKGLQDFLEFIKQRGEGYLSILSLRGLYKMTVSGGTPSVKTEHFETPILGTLIIWNATLH